MNAVELTVPEFGFLLATLECESITGLEDASLFPTNKSSRTKLLKAGRDALEQNGWIKPVPDRSDEYELDVLLLEAVSVVAAPEFMLAGTYSDDDSEAMLVFHYFAAEDIVELSALDQKRYWLSMLEGPDDVFDRLAEFMHLAASSPDVEAELDAEMLEQVSTLVEQGESAQAESLLNSSSFDAEGVASFIAALESGARGSQVIVQLEAGQIVSGDRFHVYGSGDSAWMSYKPSPSSSLIKLQPCSKETVEAFINASLNL